MKKLFIYILIASFIFTPLLADAKMAPQEVKARGTITGLRISAVDGTAFVDNLDITSLTPDKGLVLHSGSVTQANSKISAVDGTAFIDFSSGTELTDHIGKYLIYKDSAGRQIRAWIKAAGTGETLGDELITSIYNGLTTLAYETLTVNANGKNIDSAINSVDSATAYTNDFGSLGGIYKLVTDITLNSGTAPKLNTKRGGGSINQQILSTLVDGDYYRTWSVSSSFTDNGLILYNQATMCDFSLTWSAKQVLTPASTGVTLTSTKNGSTYNFEYKDPSFNYNDTSGYTYQIIDRDLSAYCDGSHLIEVYDSAGRMIKGVLKDGGVGTGETLGTETFTNPNFASGDTGWIKGSGGWAIVDQGGGNYAAVATSVIFGDQIYQSKANTIGVLRKQTAEVITYTSGTFAARAYDGVGGRYGNSLSSTGVSTLYITEGSGPTSSGPMCLTAGSAIVDNLSNKQVLTPSPSGAVIVSQKGGATQNFAYKNASFAYNQTSYFIVIKRLRG